MVIHHFILRGPTVILITAAGIHLIMVAIMTGTADCIHLTTAHIMVPTGTATGMDYITGTILPTITDIDHILRLTPDMATGHPVQPTAHRLPGLLFPVTVKRIAIQPLTVAQPAVPLQ